MVTFELNTKLKYINSGMQPTQNERLVAIKELIEDAVCSQKTIALKPSHLYLCMQWIMFLVLKLFI